MAKLVLRESGQHQTITAAEFCDRPFGTLGVIENSAYQSQVVIVAYMGVVSLTNPKHTWLSGDALQIRVLPKGTVVTLTQEEVL